MENGDSMHDVAKHKIYLWLLALWCRILISLDLNRGAAVLHNICSAKYWSYKTQRECLT